MSSSETPEEFHFDGLGVLRSTVTGQPFRSGSMSTFNKLCERCHDQAMSVAKSTYGFREGPVGKLPVEPRPGTVAIGPLFSPDFFTNDRASLVILRGAGDRTLCWSESTCVQEGLAVGSLLPWLDRARRGGFSVAVASPNLQCFGVDQRAVVYGSHVDDLFRAVASSCPAKEVSVVAFSYGGVAFCSWLSRSLDFAISRIRRVAFIESVHDIWRNLSPSTTQAFQREWAFLQTRARGWRKGSMALNEPIDFDESNTTGCALFSAGATMHELCPNIALPAVFSFLESPEAVDDELMAAIASMTV